MALVKNEAMPTQAFVDIEKIEGDVLILKTGGFRKVLLVSGVNTELKSEEEQNIIYFEYQNFLNSLEFSLQLIVHSRKLNIDKYMKLLEEREQEETDDLLKNEVAEYREFIKSFVHDNDIMTKNFFVVVPYEPTNMDPSTGIDRLLPGVMPKKKSGKEGPDQAAEERFAQSLFQLNQRVDHVVSGLNTIGLRAVALNKDELIELFYNLYNPESTEKKDINIEQNA